MYLLIEKKVFKELAPTPDKKDKEIEFTKIVKGKDSISCFIDDNLYCKMEGINNWDSFSVIGGEFTEEISKEEKMLMVSKQLSKQVNDLLIENKQVKEINKILAKRINDINIKLVKE